MRPPPSARGTPARGPRERWLPAHQLWAALGSAMLDILALALPVECAACGAADRSVCARCSVLLTPAPQSRILDDCTIVVSGVRYAGVARHCIIALKERGRTDAARHLAPALAAAVTAALGAGEISLPARSTVLLCAVPSRAESLRLRGYSPVSLLCRRALGIRPARSLALREGGVNQKTLGVDARRANAGGALYATAQFGGRYVLIVDDVVTTGATILDAARAIREAGGYVVGAAVVADTPLWSVVGKRLSPH